MSRRRRILALIGLPVLCVLATTTWLLLVHDRLPTDVAIHFGAGGVADGFASRRAVVVLFPAMQVLLWGMLGTLVAAQGAQVTSGRGLLGLPAGMVAFLGALTVTTTLPQLDAASGATTIGVGTVAVAVGAGAATWLLASVVAPPAAPVPGEQRGVPGGARPDGDAVWRTRTPTGTALPVAAGLLAVAGVALSWTAGPLVGALVLVPVIPLVVSLRFDVTVGSAGLTVRGLLGRPRVHVPLAAIREVAVEEVRPVLQYGGWGWRVRSDRTAVVTVRGPGLVVTRTDGAQLVLSLADAVRVQELLARLRERR